MKNGISSNQLNLLLARQAHLLDDVLGKAIEKAFLFGCAGEKEHRELERRLNKHALELAECPFLKPRGLLGKKGEFNLGSFDKRGHEPINLNLEDITRPGIAIGSTGSGKTTLARHIAKSVSHHIKGMILIDCMKSELAMLSSHIATSDNEVNVLDTQDMRLNFLEVPEFVSPYSYAENVVDSIVRVLKLPPVAKKAIQQGVYYLFDSQGIFNSDGKTKGYPTLFDLRQWIYDANKLIHPSARNAVLTALDSVLMSLGPVLCWRKGWSKNSLATQRSILQLHSCGELGQDLIVNDLLVSLFQSRVAQGISNVIKPDVFVYIDEGSMLLEESDMLASMLGLIRSLGISLLLSNQNAVKIHQKILSNLPNRFLCQCSSFADLNVIASSLGLTSEQKRYLSVNLRPGLMLGSLGACDWRHPFLFRVPRLESDDLPYTSGTHISKELASLDVIEDSQYRGWKPEWARKEVIVVEPEEPLLLENTPSPIADKTVQSVTELEPKELKLLKAIHNNPCQPVSFYPGEVNMSKQTIGQLRKALVAKKMIIERKVTGRGRPQIQLEPTRDGVSLLETLALQGGS